MVSDIMVASFALTEKGPVRGENQDHFLVDKELGLFAVADGLGGLPNGGKASRITLDVLKNHLQGHPGEAILQVITEVNEATRKCGYDMDVAGFGTTLTMARLLEGERELEIAHVGDSAAYVCMNGEVQCMTKEHTVATRMIEEQWQDASEAIPMAAHHTLTQCIGQDLYIDPQVMIIPVREGMRLFLLTDGATKPIAESELTKILSGSDSIERISQQLSFRIEAAGAPDNYTIVGIEF